MIRRQHLLLIVPCLLELTHQTELNAADEFSVHVEQSSPTGKNDRPMRIFGFREVVPTSQTEFVWQSSDRLGYGNPKAVIFMAHGCSHSATDFFDPSEHCEDCIGLPVERRLVHIALMRRFFVVAVSSNDRLGSRCWRYQVDQPRVKMALDTLLQREGLSELPRIAFGASSGGGFVAAWGAHRPGDWAAVCVQIMAFDPAQLPPTFPPSVWWHMPRDDFTAHRVSLAIARLHELSRPVKEYRCEEEALTLKFFSEWMPEVEPTTSRALYYSLAAEGHISNEGLLIGDPRRTEWRRAVKVVPEVASGELSLEADASGLSELLNMAWAVHEMCAGSADVLSAVFDTLESHAAARGAGGQRRGGH